MRTGVTGPELGVDIDHSDLGAEGVGGVGRALALGVECRCRRVEGAGAFQHNAPLIRLEPLKVDLHPGARRRGPEPELP